VKKGRTFHKIDKKKGGGWGRRELIKFRRGVEKEKRKEGLISCTRGGFLISNSKKEPSTGCSPSFKKRKKKGERKQKEPSPW